MVNFGALFRAAEGAEVAAARSASRVAQPASRGLLNAERLETLASTASTKPAMSFAKKAALGTAVVGGTAMLSTGVLGRNCEKVMGADVCGPLISAEGLATRITNLPGQLAEGLIFVTAGAFVVGATLLAHEVVRNGWFTATVFTSSALVAVGIVNRED